MEKEYILLNNQIMQKKDGFYQLDKDKEAVDNFLEEVESKMISFSEGSYVERLKKLYEMNYYTDLTEGFEADTIEDIARYVYSVNFKFQSFMAVSKFYKDYAMKTNDGKNYLEYYEDRIIAVALYLAQNSSCKTTTQRGQVAMNYAYSMINQYYQPATPTFLNAGKARGGEMVSCFLLEMDDSLNSIYYNISTCAQLSKIGGGVAVSLSKLRARNEAIKGIEGAASGVIPVMKLMEDTFSYVNQLGQRSGAGAAYLNIFHWDVEEFLDTKKINADEKSRMQTLSIGLNVPDKFFELVKENKPMYLFAPLSVYQETGEHLDDMDLDVRYEELVANPNIKKKMLDSRKLLTNITRTQFESGYPYLVFISAANKDNPLKGVGRIKMSNLCTEIFQVQETSTINDYDVQDEIRRDISCNLGSLNITNVMEGKSIRESVLYAIRALTAVSDLTSISNAPGIRKANEELHSVGLGALNLHGYLTKNKIAYESEFAKEFVRTFFMMVNFYSIEASMKIAKERNKTFKGFEQSEYANGTYFIKYINNDYVPTSDKVKALFEGMYIPTKKDWYELAAQVKEYGLYNAYRLAIAPTQSIGYIQNATASVLPVVELVERRTYGNATTYYPMPYLEPSNMFFYKSAYNMDMMKLIDLIAEIQEHVDQGVSMTLYVDSNTSTRTLGRYYAYAHHKGLKSLYYTRTKNLAFSECETCSV